MTQYTIDTKIPYCEEEMMFYNQSEGNKMVIPFSLYTKNLTVTLKRVYSLCRLTIPDHVMSMTNRVLHTTHDRSEHRANWLQS